MADKFVYAGELGRSPLPAYLADGVMEKVIVAAVMVEGHYLPVRGDTEVPGSLMSEPVLVWLGKVHREIFHIILLEHKYNRGIQK